MPIKSKKQLRLMEGVAHGTIKKEGLTKSVAKEYIDKTTDFKKLKEKIKPKVK